LGTSPSEMIGFMRTGISRNQKIPVIDTIRRGAERMFMSISGRKIV